MTQRKYATFEREMFDLLHLYLSRKVGGLLVVGCGIPVVLGGGASAMAV
jgi:hypothetical protein